MLLSSTCVPLQKIMPKVYLVGWSRAKNHLPHHLVSSSVSSLTHAHAEQIRNKFRDEDVDEHPIPRGNLRLIRVHGQKDGEFPMLQAEEEMRKKGKSKYKRKVGKGEDERGVFCLFLSGIQNGLSVCSGEVFLMLLGHLPSSWCHSS